MKMRAVFLMVVAAVLVSFAMPSPSFACTQPPIYPSAALHLQLWPAWNGGTDDVNIMPNNVPNGPVETAMGNWINGLLPYCYPPYLQESSVGQTGQISMSFTAAIPPPSPCPSGSICFTRGLTDFIGWTSAHRLASATTQINDAITSTAAQTEVIAHEFGHTFGLADCSYPSCSPGSSVMESAASIDVNGNPVTGVNSIIGQPGPTTCDIAAVGLAAPDYACAPPSPPDDPVCDLGFGTEGDNSDGCSPIILDIDGKGFNLTSAAGGVRFDISGTGHPVQIAWTAAGADNAFLALPGIDGLVHNGKQLFGNFTFQPPSDNPNGFAALAVYDDPKNGGNGDGIIDSRDAIYPYLRLWIDVNHDGICQPEELHTLASLGVNSISLHYSLSRRTDQYGNVFRYKAPVDPNAPDPDHVGRTAYDVFFATLPSTSTKNLIPLRGSPANARTCPVPTPTKGGMLSTTGTLR